MEASAATFPANVTKALADSQLQYAMTETGPRFQTKRSVARDALPEFDALRDQSRDIKNHVLDHLDIYLERYEAKVQASGGHVHWAATAEGPARRSSRFAARPMPASSPRASR